jgi:enediyne biosynthesis protein E4
MLARSSILLIIFLFSVALVSCHRTETLFTSLSPEKTNIHFTNQLEQRKAFGILYFLYYYNGGGVATGDINNDGLSDIYFTANSKGKNKLYLNKGNFQFEDITAKAGVGGISDWCTGVTMADVNNDGYLDIYTSSVNGRYSLQGHNELLINNGNGTFTESSAQYGLNFSGFTSQAAFFDYDHDGDLDCYLVNQSHHPHANIVDTSNRKKYDALSGDRLYRNDLIAGPNSSPVFTDVSAQAGIYQSNLGYGLGLAIADLNNDGWEDIYVSNDFHENDYYYVNNGDGTFKESGAEVFSHYSRFSMGNDVADYNNDGHLDIITVDMLPDDEKILKTYGSDENPDVYRFKLANNGYQHQYSKNCLQRNNGNGTSFSETALLSGVAATDWSWTPLFADLDNDGNKDLFITSGILKRTLDLDYIRFISDAYLRVSRNKTDKYDEVELEKMPDGSWHPYMFKGDGGLSFKDVSKQWGTADMKGYFNGASYADLDNDGNLDLVVNCLNAPAKILKNSAPKKAYLSLSFRSDSTNRFGVGAKAWLFSKGKMQYQQLMLTRGFQSSSDARLHFGLDTAKSVDSILIVWTDQKYQVIKNVPANQHLVIQKKNATGTFDHQAFFKPTPQYFTFLENKDINWQHKENEFLDYNVQYLIPHSLSTRGPKIAVGDVNSDGLDDFYACGAKGQPGTLMIQQKGGTFTSFDTAAFAVDAACEDVDATFFDANGDGSLDLYVVSGGNEYTGNNEALLDRLYLNNGKGHFTKAINALPRIFENKSCVAVADIDKDGDTDIFTGNLAYAKAYGVPQTSHLLINNGNAQFTIAAEKIMNLKDIGIVTSAAFADVNADSYPDLIVGGEWMPLSIFMNKKGQFERVFIPQSTGWWQTVFIDDINGDGHQDILAGNWGWNNKFWSGKNGPVKLYVNDFDKNGHVDQLLSYTLNGKEYPFLAKDEMERSLPVLKKHYLRYAEYAGLEMKDAFYGFAEQVEPLEAERLGSAVCYGDGKGGFTLTDLPAELQLAPIFSFQKLNGDNQAGTKYMAGGNFFDVIPYEGRYDAQALAFFSIDRKNNVRFIPQSQLASVKGQVRDIKRLNTTEGTILTVARNNEKLLMMKHIE